jgi:hypothetical protein
MMKKIIIPILSIFLMASCELTDVVDQDPPNNLVPENVVKNENDAKALLNGVYSTIISFSSPHYYMYSELVPAALSGSMSSIGFGDGNSAFVTNNVLFDNGELKNFWQIKYKVLDAANNTIALVEELPDEEFSGNTKSEIIGEAHFLRAMSSFDLLRYFGQFYDLDSEYGIIIRTEPVNFVSRNKARSSVAATYDQILSDLDYAMVNAPDFSVNHRASKTAAKALKARVLLFMGNYSGAASIANEVIESQVRQLEPDFPAVFNNGLNSSEIILLTHRSPDSDTEDNNRKRFYSGRTGNTWYPEMMEGDPRQEFTYEGLKILKVNNEETYRPTYFLRLAQMYLIKAEALAFENAALEDIQEPLNEIRLRAGLATSEATTIEAVKEEIFQEYVRELAFENGSEWFAAIRFNKIMELKPEITSEDQFILPIPEDEIFGNSELNLSDQNPGY